MKFSPTSANVRLLCDYRIVCYYGVNFVMRAANSLDYLSKLLNGSCPVATLDGDNPQTYWAAHEMAEKLVDIEESFHLWRFRHMKTVEWIIGFKSGTGGSSGVSFLKKALELTSFPELLDVPTKIGA